MNNIHEWFGWRDHPFADTSNSFKPYLTDRDTTFLKLIPGILNFGKNIVVIGDAGTGKTFLMQNMIAGLDKKCFKPVFIRHGYRTRFSFWKSIAHELQVDLTKPSQHHMMLIHEKLLAMLKQKNPLYPVIIIDDFHRYSHEAMLDICSLLTNPEAGTCGASLILCGDETLVQRLNLDIMGAVKTRITSWHFMNQLTNSQMADFIKTRLANAKADANLIEKDAIELLNSVCKGNKRETMNFCFNLLNEAMIRKEKTVSAQLILTSDYYKLISG